jgi:hypothetical protein
MSYATASILGSKLVERGLLTYQLYDWGVGYALQGQRSGGDHGAKPPEGQNEGDRQ